MYLYLLFIFIYLYFIIFYKKSIRQFTVPPNQYNDKIQLTSGVWSPHSNNVFVTANNEDVLSWDCRCDE